MGKLRKAIITVYVLAGLAIISYMSMQVGYMVQQTDQLLTERYHNMPTEIPDDIHNMRWIF